MATESISVYFRPLGTIAGVQYHHETLVAANTVLIVGLFLCAPATAKVSCLSGPQFLDRFEPARISQRSESSAILNFLTENASIYLNLFRVEGDVYRLEYKGKDEPVSFQFDRVHVSAPEPVRGDNMGQEGLYDITVTFGFKSDSKIMNLIYADALSGIIFKDIQFETGKNPCNSDAGGR
jgi:hypothetical protein